MAESRLVDGDGVPVALIRRFDRTRNGGRISHISAATIVGANPAHPREHFYTEIVDALRIHGADAQSDIEALLSVLPYFRIPKGRANEILRRIERAVSQWRERGKSLGMTKQELDQFADAFEHAERSAARQAAQRKS